MNRFFINRTNLTSLWEEDGDLKRMKAFFNTIQSDPAMNEQIKQSIKQKALDKMAKEEEPVSLPLIVEDGLVQRIRAKLRTIFGYKPWKLGVSVAAIAMMVILGQGVMNGSFDILPRMASQEKSTSMAMDQPSYGVPEDGNATNKRGVVPPQSPSPESKGTAYSADMDMGGNRQILPVPPDQALVPPADEGIPRKITHDMSVTLEVVTIEDVVSQISKEVQKLGGYVTSSQQNGSDNHSSAQMTVKIPAEKLDGLSGWLPTLGKVLNQHMTANDITNQYYDSQVRLQTLEVQEKRYLEILNQAKTVEEVIKVEDALGNIRQQVEQLKGQLKLWNNIVEYSTLNLQIVTLKSPNLNVENPWQPISWITTWQATKDAVLKTLSSTWNAINYLVVGLGYAFPYLIIGTLGWVAYRVWKKRNM